MDRSEVRINNATKGRSANRPEWFGKRVSDSAFNSSGHSDTTEPDKFADNSDDDSNYEPEEESNSPTQREFDESYDEYDETPSKKRRTSPSDSPQISIGLDFNNQFESISSKQPSDLSVNECNDSENAMAMGATTPKESVSSHSPWTKEMDGDDIKLDDRILKQMYKNSIEILARISVIEKSLQKGQFSTKSSHAHMYRNDLKLKTDQFNIFMKSNDLPLMCADNMDRFESNLKDETFKLNAVSITSLINIRYLHEDCNHICYNTYIWCVCSNFVHNML